MAGFETYLPRIAGPRKTSTPLFPSYCFIVIEAQWHAARWSPGIINLLMTGEGPARVGAHVIEELRSREVRGLVRLPKRSSLNGGSLFAPGDQVRVRDGALRGFVGLVQDMKPHARIEVLLTMLGSLQKVELAAASVERLA